MNGHYDGWQEHGEAARRIAYRAAFSRLNNPATADEVAQEAMLYLLKREDFSFDHPGWKKMVWLVGWTQAVRSNRSDTRRARHTLEAVTQVTDDGSEITLEIVDEKPDRQPEEATLRSERAKMVQEAINTLAPEQRRIIALYYSEQLSVLDIAEIVGRSASWVKTNLSRTRQVLQRQLSAYLNDEYSNGGMNR